MGAIQALGQQVQALGQQMANRFDVLENRFDILENRQANFEIAAVNARLFAMDTGSALQPLLDVRNGGDILHFPATLIQLHALDGMSVSHIRMLAPTYPPLTYRSYD